MPTLTLKVRLAALRLFEALILLVPIWIAVTRYVLDDKGELTQKNILGGFLISIGYLFLLLSFLGIRNVFQPIIETASLGMAVDAIIFFVLIVAVGMLLGYFDKLQTHGLKDLFGT
ncbi:hypothetical protein [Halalkalicoccus tibetensis]|uniref:DUF1616 domain-containing protein n=1 Tax=Halalkalicoccus tibetensis TaxID=175632 RepID=A0ABD5V719_9EURY